MALDIAAISAKVASLTTDLEPMVGATAQDLDEARASLAIAVFSGQPELQAARSAPPDLLAGAARFAAANAHVQSIVTSVLAKPPAVRQLVNRRSFPVPSAAADSTLPDFTNGRAVDRTLGPFRDTLGRPVWIDLFLLTNSSGWCDRPVRLPFVTVPIKRLIASGLRLQAARRKRMDRL